MDEPVGQIPPNAPSGVSSVGGAQSTAPKRKLNLVSIFILFLVLLAIPMTVIYLGQQTRQEIKAGQTCKSPPIPDPADCVGGTWKLNKDVAGCIHFRCELQ